MARLEDLTRGATVKGILPDRFVTIVDVKWHGSTVVEVTYKDASGHLGNELLYRDREPTLEIVTQGTPFSFDGDGAQFRLASEARRISLAYLFDPLLAVHTSIIEPLPHQITAVYGEMLPRQPLRFLLADDPGAGKTIMAGLLIKELMIRGDLHRCLICCPGNLAEHRDMYGTEARGIEPKTNHRCSGRERSSHKPKTQFDAMKTQFRRNSGPKCLPEKAFPDGVKRNSDRASSGSFPSSCPRFTIKPATSVACYLRAPIADVHWSHRRAIDEP